MQEGDIVRLKAFDNGTQTVPEQVAEVIGIDEEVVTYCVFPPWRDEDDRDGIEEGGADQVKFICSPGRSIVQGSGWRCVVCGEEIPDEEGYAIDGLWFCDECEAP